MKKLIATLLMLLIAVPAFAGVLDPPEETPEQKAFRTAQAIIKCNNANLNAVVARYENSFNLLWQSDNPQLVLDLFGTDAVALFAASQAVQQFIQSFVPTYVAPEPTYEYTINEDGTVTVGDPIPQDPVE